MYGSFLVLQFCKMYVQTGEREKMENETRVAYIHSFYAYGLLYHLICFERPWSSMK